MQDKAFEFALVVLGAGLCLVFATEQHRWGVFLSVIALAFLGIDCRRAISSFLTVSTGGSPLALAGFGFLLGLLLAAGVYWVLRVPNQDISRPTTPERTWPSLDRAQIAALRNRLAVMPLTVEGRDNRQISIIREEFPDCANLADDIAQAFKDAGWIVIDGGPNKIFGKIPDGIHVTGPPIEPRRAPVLAAISEALGPAYEPIQVGVRYSAMAKELPALGPDGKHIVRVAIGRKPRQK